MGESRDMESQPQWPLMGAIRHNDEELALALLAMPVPAGERLDWGWKTPNGYTLMHHVAGLGRSQLVRELLKREVQ